MPDWVIIAIAAAIAVTGWLIVRRRRAQTTTVAGLNLPENIKVRTGDDE